jgi:cell division protein FtsB
MKKNMLFWSLLCVLLFGFGTSAFAQSKALQKDIKKRVKQLEKEGWKLQASTQTLTYAITKFRTYLEEDPENRIEIVGIAEGRNEKTRENAVANGIANYATRAAVQVVGKLKALFAQDTATGEEIDKFGAAYEIGVNTRIKALVKQHFVLVKTDKNGNKVFNAFLSLDESQARKAREEAAREAAEKAKLTNLSEQVKEFIGEPVPAE